MFRMHRLWGVAAVLISTGCLKEKVQYCNNGALCPEPLVCTENAAEPFCGDRDTVGPCMGKLDEAPCVFPGDPNGYCLASVCTKCDPNLAFCGYEGFVAMTTPTSDDLFAVLVVGPRDVYAAGRNGAFIHWNGIAWERLTGPAAGDLRTLAGTTGSMFASISNSIYRYDGTAWSAPDTSSPQPLFALWSAGANDVFAAGFRATTGHYTGAWSFAAPFGENTLNLSPSGFNGVWGTAANDVFAAGTNGLVIHWDGSAWLQQPTNQAAYSLRAIGGSSSTDLYAAGSTGIDAPVLLHFTGEAWTDVTASLPPAKRLLGVYAADAANVFVVGENGHILRGAGTSWTSMTTATTTIFNAVGGADREVFAVGNGGTVLRYRLP